MTFDLSRSDVGLPPSHRSRVIVQQRTLVVHYPGVDVDFVARGHAESIRATHHNHMRDEYNTTSMLEETAVWAGDRQGAHAGNSINPASGHEGPVPYPTDGQNRNRYRLGHCAWVPLKRPHAAEVDRWVTGIRRARQSYVDVGWLTPDHNVVQHGHIATTGTACPGWLADPDVWAQIVAPLTPEPPPPEEEPGVLTLDPPQRVYDTADDKPMAGNSVRQFPRFTTDPDVIALEVQLHVTVATARGYFTSRPRGAGDWDQTSKGTYNPGQWTTLTTTIVLGPDGFTLGNGGGGQIEYQIDVLGYRYS